MKKIVKLTETDLKNIIKKVIKESTNQQKAQKITALRNMAKGEAKTSSCWTKGMCPKRDGHNISNNECEVCPGPIAGILIPTIGAIAGAIIGVKNRAQQRKREEQEFKWIQHNPNLKDRKFIYFTDGSVQAFKEEDVEDVMVFNQKNNVWEKSNSSNYETNLELDKK